MANVKQKDQNLGGEMSKRIDGECRGVWRKEEASET